MPGAARRMYPARTRSRWLATSASTGSSRRVRTNKVDIRSSMGPAYRDREGSRSSSHGPQVAGRRHESSPLEEHRREGPDLAEPDGLVRGEGAQVVAVDVQRH